MLGILYPKLYVRTLQDIDLEQLKTQNICGLIFDLDNTLVAWDKKELDALTLEWMRKVHLMGFKVVVVSNNNQYRVKTIAENLNVPYVSRALKPVKSGFRQALNLMQLETKQVAVIGDQLFTDVLGGNRLGMFTIWVESLSNKEFIGTRITRQIEKLAVKLFKLKMIKQEEQ